MTGKSQKSYSKEEVLRIGRGEIFGMEAPKLPMPNMLMLDRIVEVTEDGGEFGRGLVIAELDIDPDLWFFKCHFAGDPVMPGCLGLDAMWQLTGFYLAWRGFTGKGRALGVKNLRFSGQVLPENKLVTYKIHIRRVFESKLIMAQANGIMEVDGKAIYKAEDMRVGLFGTDMNL